MGSSIITVTARMLQTASHDLNTEDVTDLGLAIWLLGDLLGVLCSWWAFFQCTGVAMGSSIITVTARMLQTASHDLNTEDVTDLGLAIWLLGDLLGVLYSWWTFFVCAGVALGKSVVTVPVCTLDELPNLT